jgi:hypothetical protein
MACPRCARLAPPDSAHPQASRRRRPKGLKPPREDPRLCTSPQAAVRSPRARAEGKGSSRPSATPRGSGKEGHQDPASPTANTSMCIRRTWIVARGANGGVVSSMPPPPRACAAIVSPAALPGRSAPQSCLACASSAHYQIRKRLPQGCARRAIWSATVPPHVARNTRRVLDRVLAASANVAAAPDNGRGPHALTSVCPPGPTSPQQRPDIHASEARNG